MKGKRVCRCHGAMAGAPKGEGNGRYRTGRFTAEVLTERRRFAELLRETRELMQAMREA